MFGRIALVISAAIYCFPRRADETRLYPRSSITFLHPFYLFPGFFRNSIVSCSMKLRLLFQHGSSHFWSIWSKITLLIFSHTVCNHQFREKIKDLILFLFEGTLTYILLYIIYYINLWYTNGILLHFFFHLLSDPFHFDFKEVIEESDLSVAHSFRNVRILTPKSLTVGILQNDIWSTEVPHKIDECRETRQKAGEYRWTSWEAVSSDGTYSSLETFKFTSITRHRGYHYYRPETSSSFLWSDRFPCFSFLLHSGPLSFQ